VGPKKGHFFSSFSLYFLPAPLSNLLGDFLLAETFSLFPDWPTPSAFLPLTLYNPSTSQLYHFSPEDGDSMFLQNIGIPTKLHGNKTQNTITYIFTAERTSNSVRI